MFVVELSRNDLSALGMTLNKLKDRKGNIRYAYGIAKNSRAIEGEIETIRESFNRADENFSKFQKERFEILEKYCKRDSDGQPVIENDQYAFDDAVKEALQLDLNAVIEKYSDVIKDVQEKNRQFDEFMKEKVTVSLFKMNMDDFSSDDFEPVEINTLLDAQILE